MINKDWTGNTQSVMATLGSSSHSNKDRPETDYYATPELAVRELLKLEKFSSAIWECACGELHITKILEESGYTVRSSDIIDRVGNEVCDFLDSKQWDSDIITNPPFAKATEFLEHALNILPNGSKIAFFLRIQFLEGVKRRAIFNENPPIRIWVSSRNLRWQSSIFNYGIYRRTNC